jgi:hypothetical protein
MSYIDESLAPNEELIYRARFHWLQKAWAYVTLAVIVVIAVGSLALVQGVPALIIAAAIAVLGLVIFVAMMTPIWTTEIGVTNHRFIFKRGWLSTAFQAVECSPLRAMLGSCRSTFSPAMRCQRP